MSVRKGVFLWIALFIAFQPLSATSLTEQFKCKGYVEICKESEKAATFDSL